MAPVGRFEPAKVTPSPSGSVALIGIVFNWPSVAVCDAPTAPSTGGRLTLPTVMVTTSKSLCAGIPLSVTVMVTL